MREAAMTHLTPHFSLDELTLSQTAARQGLDNTPTEAAMKNLKRLAETLEKVRAVLGERPILISSGYRSPKVNAAVGGSKSSAHMHGLAADFTCPSFGTPIMICEVLEPLLDDLAIDQLIHEYAAWVHLGLVSNDKPRHQALTIDGNGARYGF